MLFVGSYEAVSKVAKAEGTLVRADYPTSVKKVRI
jgi:hypothetical protein